MCAGENAEESEHERHAGQEPRQQDGTTHFEIFHQLVFDDRSKVPTGDSDRLYSIVTDRLQQIARWRISQNLCVHISDVSLEKRNLGLSCAHVSESAMFCKWLLNLPSLFHLPGPPPTPSASLQRQSLAVAAHWIEIQAFQFSSLPK